MKNEKAVKKRKATEQNYSGRGRVPLGKGFALSLQHMFAMFGASVLVPMIFHVNPGIVLLMNGIGTLLFILITKGKAPAYLGSSFCAACPRGAHYRQRRCA